MKRKRSKSHNVLKKKQPKKPVDPNIEEIYEEEITFMCPVRGLVKQKVKVKRYKSKLADGEKVIVGSENGSDIIDQLEREDDGLSIYTEEDLKKEED